MFRRSFLGLFEGLLIGLSLGAASVRLGLGSPSAVVLALLAGATGFAMGLIAGRPIWARDAKTEALLKGAAGALVGAVGSVALGHWLRLPVNLAEYRLGAGPAGMQTIVVLPAIAIALGLFFELDNTAVATAPAPSRAKSRLAEPAAELDELSEIESSDDEASRKLEKR